MRQLRRLSIAVVLTFMLATAAFAGSTIDCPAPPPVTASSANGIVETPNDQQSLVATNDEVDVAVSLLQSLLLVF